MAQQEPTTNNFKIDMATILRAIPEFNGNPDEDIERWLSEALLATDLANLPEQDTLRALIFSLRGEVRSWVIHYRKSTPVQLNLENFITIITNRFSTQSSSEKL
jgi:hypothetical protein